MEPAERERVGARVRRARLESGLTQAKLARFLGITTRSVQSYESGAIVPWRHLSRIETVTHQRPGWLLRSEDGGRLEVVLTQLVRAIEQQQELLRSHPDARQQDTKRLRRQREALAEQLDGRSDLI